jgi:hypothetical protein
MTTDMARGRLWRLVPRGLHSKPHRVLLVHAFRHDEALLRLKFAFFLGFLRHVREVDEVVLGVIPLPLSRDLVAAIRFFGGTSGIDILLHWHLWRTRLPSARRS